MKSQRYRFGIFEFDSATRQLWRDGVRVSMQAQPAQVLGCLIQRAGSVVSRDDLRQAVWGGETFVDFDSGLNFCISQIRTALRDDSSQPVYIRTIPKIGYQFIAPVEQTPERATVSADHQPIAPAQTASAKSRIPVLAIGFSLVAVVILAAGYWFWFARASKQIPVVAVLRFDNETGNPDLLRFSDGLTDNVVEQLTSQSRGRYAVIGNAQILRPPREQRDLSAIASSLHATYVVLGQVQSSNGQIRILAHLIHLPEQTHIWVDRLDRTLADQLTVESEAAQKIGSDFSVRVAAGDTRPFSAARATH
jgi:DNA-binding winged helix-turn-helix (wHTH) protein/TolB-like protein